jgi:hypothetical protein
VATSAVSAQGDRITIQLTPKPNQVVRYHSVQEMRFTLPSGGATADPSPSLPGLGNIVATIDTVHTVTLDVPDAQGHAEARFTYDQFTMQISVNGQTMPLPFPVDTILRQSFTAIVDCDGRIVDFKGSDQNPMLAAIKPLLAITLGGTSVTLSPGETASVPLSAELALPIPGAVGAMTMTGEAKYTLVSVDAGSAGRVAHLNMTVTGRLVTQDTQAPAAAMGMTMSMSGDGTLDVDVARGVVTLRKQRQTIDMEIKSGVVPPMKMTGLITSTVTAE